MNTIPGYVDPYTASLAASAYGMVSKALVEKKDKAIEARIEKLNKEQKEKVNPSEPGSFSCYA
jgi:hypothetical protein